MYKISVSLILVMLSLNVFATPIPQEQLGAYKEAVIMGLYKGQWTCQTTPSQPESQTVYMVRDLIQSSASGDLSSSGSQPLLTFLRSVSLGLYQDHVKITTSADEQSILSFTVNQYEQTRINVGSLRNPVMVNGLKLVNEVSCQARE